MNGASWIAALGIGAITFVVVVTRPDSTTLSGALILIAGLAGWHTLKSANGTPTTTTP